MTDLPLSMPDITDAEVDAVVDVLRSGRLSIGPKQELFEDVLAGRIGRRHGIAVSSGTSGLHLVLLALGVGPGDEVVTSPFSFIATANAIAMCGARPVFADIDPTSLNMTAESAEKVITEKTKAILGVEVFGNPTHMDQLERLANAREIPLIEDACEAIGGKSGHRKLGSFGRASVFGFYPNKQITTGEGGMILTDDDRLASLCRSMRNQGRPDPKSQPREPFGGGQSTGSWLQHERLGYNYRLSEISAALGIAQLDRLEGILEKRRDVACEYIMRLKELEDIILPTVPVDHEESMSWFVFVIRLTAEYGRQERDRIIAGLRRHDVGASNYFPCIHLQPFFREQFGHKPGDFPVAESISDRTIALPFFNKMDSTQIELVCHTLKVMIQREQLLRR
ncbi:DegT/DnrJ/EryC1/StrS family aminotransferase [Mucisphaera sp.]|uniref:DegT/DnrJ/EryC1/StrS family aminotransferase n=1 Tax=Mucisphaera sp. TaxID=2913024 RepID=UPI003D0A6A20